MSFKSPAEDILIEDRESIMLVLIAATLVLIADCVAPALQALHPPPSLRSVGKHTPRGSVPQYFLFPATKKNKALNIFYIL